MKAEENDIIPYDKEPCQALASGDLFRQRASLIVIPFVSYGTWCRTRYMYILSFLLWKVVCLIVTAFLKAKVFKFIIFLHFFKIFNDKASNEDCNYFNCSTLL